MAELRLAGSRASSALFIGTPDNGRMPVNCLASHDVEQNPRFLDDNNALDPG
jgi:hypothetical protein